MRPFRITTSKDEDCASRALDGQAHTEGAKEGVVSFGAFSDAVPQEVQDAVKAAEEDLKSGAATFGG